MNYEINDKYFEQVFECLRLIANLPDGVGVVGLLGNGDEGSNNEALRTWARKKVDDSDVNLCPRDLATNLATALRVEIEEFMHSFLVN